MINIGKGGSAMLNYAREPWGWRNRQSWWKQYSYIYDGAAAKLARAVR